MGHENRRITGLPPTGILAFALAHSTGFPSSQPWCVTPAVSIVALQRQVGKWSAQVIHAMDGPGWVQTGPAGIASSGRSRVNLHILSGVTPVSPRPQIQLGSSLPVSQFLSHHLLALKLLSHPFLQLMSWLVCEQNGLRHNPSLPGSEEMHTDKTGNSPEPQRTGAHLLPSCGPYPVLSLGL